jgi:hypothetical protein
LSTFDSITNSNTLAKKIHKLEETIKPDFQLIGVSSYENDYRVCWDINNCLKIDLQRRENLVINDRKTGISREFPLFQFEDENMYVVYKLIGNKSENGLLVKEWKNIDFLLKISGEFSKKNLADTLLLIKKSILIQTAIILEVNQQKTLQLLHSIH